GYRIIQRGGFNIALVGVLDPHGLGESLGHGLTVDKMETTLSKLLPTLRGKADIVILLAFTDETTLARLAQEFYELDLIIGGKVSQPSQHLQKENRSVIVFVTNESRALGALRAQILGRGKLSVTEFQMLMLNDRIPEHPEVLALAEKYRGEVRNTRLHIDDLSEKSDNLVPGVKVTTGYAGSESCLGCHPTAATSWEKSGHAEAFDTLMQAKADADPHCIACHTVGFGTATGYRREFAGRKLANVGCESCHGPASLHVKQRKSEEPVTFRLRPLGAGDCKKCHYGEFSRPFDWDKFWPKVQHGKEKG
ncbi:MAG TPA: multiheme c-type cytochrome, partial [Verrucomicrobiae bacterium]